MKALRSKAAKAMEEFNAKHPGAGGQAFVRKSDGVHLIDKDGNVADDPAAFNSQTQMYEQPPKAAAASRGTKRYMSSPSVQDEGQP